jgi:hypothetical protein
LQDLHDIDFNLALSENGAEYSGKFQFSMNGEELVSAKTTYKPGFASAVVNTPVPDYATILLQVSIL